MIENLKTENDIISWIIYNGNNLSIDRKHAIVKKMEGITSQNALKLLVLLPHLDNSIIDMAISKITDATFLERLMRNKIKTCNWSTRFYSCCNNRLEKLPNTIKFITE